MLSKTKSIYTILITLIILFGVLVILQKKDTDTKTPENQSETVAETQENTTSSDIEIIYEDGLDVKSEKNIYYNSEKELDIYYPAKSGSYPLVMWFSGGNGNSKSNSEDIAKEIASYGFVVVATNYGESDLSISGEGRIRNALSAADYVWKNASKYKIDTSKNVLAGGTSFGGIISSLFGTITNEPGFNTYNISSRIGGVVDMFGSVELNPDASKANVAFSSLFGCENPYSCPQADILRVSQYINSSDVPFLIIHGLLDNTSDPQQSINLKNTLDSKNIEATLILDEDNKHDSEMAFEYIDQIINFFREKSIY
ncbi:prolyl oligopeptidase family serine peptidase [Candidatus Nomurabacteria bacterium]|nr:prolyl oligopeptidase family serine peptidase [Candidatus Nomurabacteria bacterium]USN94587.1 MAG: prolyl oligopeptidase family serine peptidase [Candidatus Nomurabacteria bacterium]